MKQFGHARRFGAEVTFCLGMTGWAIAPASASTLTWTLDNVKLTDGQSLTGSFNYDRDTNSYSNIAISNSGTAIWPATNFIHWNPFFGNFEDGTPAVNDIVLHLTYAQPLTNAGGAVALSTAPSSLVFFRCSVADCTATFAFASQFVNVVSGQVIASVPLPAAAWLLGAGLLGLIGVARGRA